MTRLHFSHIVLLCIDAALQQWCHVAKIKHVIGDLQV